MIAIVDYNTGNLRSVENAVKALGQEYIVTDDAATIRSASHVLLPGVGEASKAMEELRRRGLDTLIPSLTQPVLGICIGLQLMCLSSEEGDAKCMGIFPTKVTKFREEPGIKIPHMGWNTIEQPLRHIQSQDATEGDTLYTPLEGDVSASKGGALSSPLFAGVPEGSFVYFVHSFAPECCKEMISSTGYGSRTFASAISKGNFFGTQFHPEKSGSVGRQILRNFLSL